MAGKVHIIGYGNPLRGDDVVGRVVARRLASIYPEGGPVRVLESQQLTPELAAELADVALVVFLDARVGGQPGAIACEEISPGMVSAPVLFHDLSPSVLLEMAGNLFGCRANGLLFTVSGQRFGPGSEISPPVAGAVEELVSLVGERLAAYRSEGEKDPVSQKGWSTPLRP
jgi:hydrogenase maturation protease